MRRILLAFATAASAAVLGATGVAQAAPATSHPHVVKPNATPACGFNCFNLFSLTLGRHTVQNAYVPGDTGVGGKVGQKVNMNFASNSHPNEDFTGAQVGTLGDFCPNLGGSGLSPTSYACINYPAFYPVFESNWSPFGNESDLCVGAAQPLVNNENVTLRDCGVSASTIWVGDLKNDTIHNGHLYIPWVNGASTQFSHPLVLTVDPGTKSPANQLRVRELSHLTNGVAPDAQEFSFTFGPVNS